MDITRFDFVRQPDGSYDWCVEVTQTAPDPFNDGQTLSNVVGPLTPGQAKERFGLTLEDVLATVDHGALAKVEALTADLAAEREAHAVTRSEAERDLRTADEALVAQTARLEASETAHAQTRAELDELRGQLENTQ